MIPDPNDRIAEARRHIESARYHAGEARRHADDAVRYAKKAQRWAWASVVLQVIALSLLIVRAVQP